MKLNTRFKLQNYMIFFGTIFIFEGKKLLAQRGIFTVICVWHFTSTALHVRMKKP